jgi:hypothetical protein
VLVSAGEVALLVIAVLSLSYSAFVFYQIFFEFCTVEATFNEVMSLDSWALVAEMVVRKVFVVFHGLGLDSRTSFEQRTIVYLSKVPSPPQSFL